MTIINEKFITVQQLLNKTAIVCATLRMLEEGVDIIIDANAEPVDEFCFVCEEQLVMTQGLFAKVQKAKEEKKQIMTYCIDCMHKLMHAQVEKLIDHTVN